MNFYSRTFFNIALISIAAVMCACSSGNAGSNTGEIAAKVNSTPISLVKVDRQIEQGLKQQNLNLSNISPMELESARMRVLDQLITQEVLLQRAQRENISVSEEEVKQEVQKLVSAQGWTQEELQKQLKEASMSEEDFRDEQRQHLLIAKLQERQKSKIPTPSEKEISDYYNQNRDQFKIGRGIFLSQIMIDPQNNGLKNDALGEEQVKQKISTVAARLKAGDDFATVARMVSEDIQSAQQGGDLGFASEEALNSYPESLVKRFFSMREGEITEPIQGSAGRMYIFKVTGKKTEPQELKLEDPDVKKRIADTIREQREQVLNGALLFVATNEAKVENFLAQRILQNPSNLNSIRPNSPIPAQPIQPATPTEQKEPSKSQQQSK